MQQPRSGEGGGAFLLGDNELLSLPTLPQQEDYMLRFHILHRSGWIGGADHRPVHDKTEAVKPLLSGNIEVSREAITIHEADWDRARLLMPIYVRQLMRNKQEQTEKEKLLQREYAPDAAPRPDSNILLPVGVTGR